MKINAKGQPDTVAKTESTSTNPVTTVVAKNDLPKVPGEVQPMEFDSDTLASAELLVEQAAKAESQLIKLMVSSGVVQCYQGRFISKAKKKLNGKSKNDAAVEAANPTSQWIFHAQRLPGILEADEAAVRLGIAPHAIPVLIGAGHIKPLGKPTDKSSKKFSADYVEILAHDQKWLDKAIRIIGTHWATENQKKKARPIAETFRAA